MCESAHLQNKREIKLLPSSQDPLYSFQKDLPGLWLVQQP